MAQYKRSAQASPTDTLKSLPFPIENLTNVEPIDMCVSVKVNEKRYNHKFLLKKKL